MQTLMDELARQPEALHDLAHGYDTNPGWLDLGSSRTNSRFLLTGMGASFHAASIAALNQAQLGLPSSAVEASDLLNYSYKTMGTETLLIYISQSGESAEVAPLLRRLDPARKLLVITNQPESTLARQALARRGACLPLFAGLEEWIASKTYTNSLALLWLVARQVSGRWDGTELAALHALADVMQTLLETSSASSERLLSTFNPSQPVIFLGHGPHAFTARQASMILSEWTKSPNVSSSIAGFRHGFIEAVQAGSGILIFAPPGAPTTQSALQLADELQTYGAHVLLNENGKVRHPGEAAPEGGPLDEWLSPILDILPIEYYAHHLALLRGYGKGFRYLQKVVKDL